MVNSDYPKVSVKILQQTVELYHRIELFFALLMLVGSGLAVFYWFDRFMLNIPTLGGAVFLWATALAFFQLEVPEGTLIDQVEPATLGRYTAEELHDMIKKICVTFDECEVPNIYLIESAEGNAFVLNVDILNFVRRWNAVYISSYLLHAFEQDELEAVLSHELCHFSLHATFWNRFFYLQPVIFGIWVTFVISYPIEWLWLKTSGGINFWLVVFLLGLFGVTRWLWKGATFVGGIVMIFALRPDSQEIESLCDYEAAKRFGVLPMINALLKIGSRQEIFSVLFSMLSPDDADPLRLPDKATFSGGSRTRSRMVKKHPAYLRAKERINEGTGGTEKPNKEPTEDEIHEAMLLERSEVITKAYEHLSENLPKGFISLEQSLHLINEALETSEGETYQHKPRELLRWLEHDNLIPNYRIDEEEYPSFLNSLQRHSDVPLFFIPEEFTPALAVDAEHPTLKNRILFLEHNREGQGLCLY